MIIVRLKLLNSSLYIEGQFSRNENFILLKSLDLY